MPVSVLDHLRQDQPRALDRLMDLLRIPSVSTDPAYKAHVQTAADWVASTLRDIGLDVQVHSTAGHPIVVGTTPESLLLEGAADSPHVLFYGHYDVQPPDPLELWHTKPFEPTVRNGAIYARGASDDKGQIMTFIEALRAWKATRGGLPVRATVLIEGEEECGSIHLQPFIAQHKDLLKADIALVSDTGMRDRNTPAITYGLRGLVYYDIQLHGPSRDLHSGIYGGTLANPATLLTRVLGGLFDSSNRITLPGFYDGIHQPTAEERRMWDAMKFDEVGELLGPVGSQAFGEAGYSTLERKWIRPSCDVNGLYGGYMGKGAKTVIPSFAGAKVSFRLAPWQNGQKVAAAFEAWLRGHDVGGCRWQITNLGVAEPVLVSFDSPYIAASQRAFQRAVGKDAILIREGATIPVVADFKRVLGIDTLLIGFGLSDDCLHSPNEKFDIHCFDLGCRAHAMLLNELRAKRLDA